MPKSVVNSYYGRTSSNSYIFGDESIHTPLPGVEIHNPMAEDGTVEDWETAQKLWEYTLTSRLVRPVSRNPVNSRSKNGSKEEEKEENGEQTNGDEQAMDVDAADESEALLADNPILMTEPAWNSAKNREKSIEIALESWGAPAFWTARNGVLAAYASPPTTLLRLLPCTS